MCFFPVNSTKSTTAANKAKPLPTTTKTISPPTATQVFSITTTTKAIDAPTTTKISVITTTKQYQLQQQLTPYQLQQQWQQHLEKPKIGILHVSITMILVWTEFNLCDNKHYVGLFLARLVCFALTNEIVVFNKLSNFVINWIYCTWFSTFALLVWTMCC